MFDYASVLSLSALVAQIALIFILGKLCQTKLRLQVDLSLLIALVLGIFGVNLLHLCFLAVGMGGDIFNISFILFVISIFLVQKTNIYIQKRQRPNPSYLLGVSLIAFLTGIQTLVNAFKQESSIDGLLYHGPILGNFVSGKSIWKFDAINQYQYYTDLTMVGAINLVGLTKVARFDDAVQVPYMLVFAAAVSSLLSGRVQSPLLRFSIAAIILASPVVWLQPRIQYVDLAYASSILAAVALMLTTKSKIQLVYLAMGVAVAAVVATKPTGLIIGILAVLGSLIVIIREDDSIKSKFSFSAAFLIPVLAGTLFYVRNIFEFGNPLYPVAVKAGPIQLPGPIDLTVFTTRGGTEGGLFDAARIGAFISNVVDGAVNGVTKLDYDPRSGGFSYVSWVVPLLALIAVSAFFIRKRNNENVFQTINLSLSLLFSALVVLCFQPGASDSRYVIAPYALIFCAVILATPRLPMQNVVSGFLVIATLVSIYWNEINLYMGIKSVTPQLTSQIAAALPGGQPPILDPGPAFEWVPKSECVKIAIQTEGGVNGGGMAELTYQNTLSYGYFGNQLCNDLEILVVPLSDMKNMKLNEETLDEIGDSQYLVTYVDSSDWFKSQVAHSGILLKEIKLIEGRGDYPQESILFKVNHS